MSAQPAVAEPGVLGLGFGVVLVPVGVWAAIALLRQSRVNSRQHRIGRLEKGLHLAPKRRD